MEAQGYVTGETLIGAEDRSLVTVMLTWNSLKEWQQWEASEIRVKLYERIRPHLLEEPHVRVYRYLSYQKKPEEKRDQIFDI
jgi:heme-degrading monooxygenase HmoA